MLAIVPMRCMSIGDGSSSCGSRCIRMPTGRCSRTACCAAAIERCRPTVTGITTPGNRTKFRTGMMIIASGGNGGSGASGRVWFGWMEGDPPPCSMRIWLISATGHPRLLKRDHDAAAGRLPADRRIAAGRQTDAPLETALRQFKTVDYGGTELGGQHAAAGHNKIAPVDCGLHVV